MRTVLLIVLVATVAGLLIARLLARVRPQLGERVRLSSHLLVRFAAAVVLGGVAVQLAQEDDPLLLGLALLVGLIALFSLLLCALLVWRVVDPSWGIDDRCGKS